ncbi:hypothetical protein GL50803_0016916 [Giardia duodenalis]|uniref:Uncharacterized protein n=1 Tax=Giardia intestinalis (strain ATCC 50803 / WB clone C6) TaxID=184922 RepID=A8B9I2_GIAIC|nr:hypothetical protein GL50803_0016916 [Giardia intestinalis]KAE8306121.1 hypothetical protein GL50803_0016916 [Giardia intestinalis]|eukprot:XP_001708491.1 Hypothetical protein GL50803_16916 [Giardia lamblia ATCC 50803]
MITLLVAVAATLAAQGPWRFAQVFVAPGSRGQQTLHYLGKEYVVVDSGDADLVAANFGHAHFALDEESGEAWISAFTHEDIVNANDTATYHEFRKVISRHTGSEPLLLRDAPLDRRNALKGAEEGFSANLTNSFLDRAIPIVINCLSIELSPKTKTEMGYDYVPETIRDDGVRKLDAFIRMMTNGRVYIDNTTSWYNPAGKFVEFANYYATENDVPKRIFEIVKTSHADWLTSMVQNPTMIFYSAELFDKWASLRGVGKLEYGFTRSGKTCESGPVHVLVHLNKEINQRYLYWFFLRNTGTVQDRTQGTKDSFFKTYLMNGNANDQHTVTRDNGVIFPAGMTLPKGMKYMYQAVENRWMPIHMPNDTSASGTFKYRLLAADSQYSRPFLMNDAQAYVIEKQPKSYYYPDLDIVRTDPVPVATGYATYTANDTGQTYTYNPDDVYNGLKRSQHVIGVELFLPADSFISTMDKEEPSVIIEYRAAIADGIFHDRGSFKINTGYFKGLGNRDFHSVSLNLLSERDNAGKWKSRTLPNVNIAFGRLWVCPDCDRGTFTVRATAVNTGIFDKNDITHMTTPFVYHDVTKIPSLDVEVTYIPNTPYAGPHPDSAIKFRSLEIQTTYGTDCFIKSSQSPRVDTVVCSVTLSCYHIYCELAGMFYAASRLDQGPLRFFYDDFVVTKNTYTYTLRSTASQGTTDHRLYRMGGLGEYGIDVEFQWKDRSIVNPSFEEAYQFYTEYITAKSGGRGDQYYVFKGLSTYNRTVIPYYYWWDGTNNNVLQSLGTNGYLAVFGADWTALPMQIVYDSNSRTLADRDMEPHSDVFRVEWTNVQCGFSASSAAFFANGTNARRGWARIIANSINDVDRVAFSHMNYTAGTFLLTPAALKVGQPLDQECWSQINRRTLYRAHRWHNLYARGQDNTNYEFYLDFDSDLPSGLVVYIDTVEKTHVIDTRMMKVVQKSINSQPGNKRFISTSLRFNYSILYKDTEFRIRGGITSTSLRFAFNKDVYLVGVRHVMNGYGKQQDLRNGTINFRVRSANFKGEAWRNITGYMYQPFQVTVFDAAPSSRSSAVCNFETSYTECQMTLPESLKQEQLVHVPPHQFSDDGFQHTNLRCENGKYLWLHANGTYACEPCHAGYYCKDSVMRRCPFGHYSEDGASVCKTPYTNIDRFDSPSAANEKELTYDAPFYFQYNADGTAKGLYPCNGNMYYDKDTKTCRPCPRTGYYCLSGEDPKPCPAGFRCISGVAYPCYGNYYSHRDRMSVCLPLSFQACPIKSADGTIMVSGKSSTGDARWRRPGLEHLSYWAVEEPNVGCRECPRGHKCEVTPAGQRLLRRAKLLQVLETLSLHWAAPVFGLPHFEKKFHRFSAFDRLHHLEQLRAKWSNGPVRLNRALSDENVVDIGDASQPNSNSTYVTITPCKVSEYSAPGSNECTTCPAGQIVNTHGDGCVSLNIKTPEEAALDDTPKVREKIDAEIEADNTITDTGPIYGDNDEEDVPLDPVPDPQPNPNPDVPPNPPGPGAVTKKQSGAAIGGSIAAVLIIGAIVGVLCWYFLVYRKKNPRPQWIQNIMDKFKFRAPGKSKSTTKVPDNSLGKHAEDEHKKTLPLSRNNSFLGDSNISTPNTRSFADGVSLQGSSNNSKLPPLIVSKSIVSGAPLGPGAVKRPEI